MSKMVLQLKENQNYVANILEPIFNNSELREQMIEHMTNHNQMMISLQEHSGWMNSVHQSELVSKIDQEMGSKKPGKDECSWCPEVKKHFLQAQKDFHRPNIMEDLMHQIWVFEEIRTQMNNSMLENQYHMAQMTRPMISPLLELIMDDPKLREQMIDMMLENQEFMNSVRHENNFSD